MLHGLVERAIWQLVFSLLIVCTVVESSEGV